MEHLIFCFFPLFVYLFLFLAFLQIWCLHSNPSRRLKVFYVLCMFSLLIGARGCKVFMSVNPPNSPLPAVSLLPLLSHTTGRTHAQRLHALSPL